MDAKIDARQTARRIRENLPLQEVFRRYGHPPDRRGYVRCPFHQEKTPSLKLFDDGWFKCFGCGESGTAIDLVMKLYGLSFPQAVLRLCVDFGLAPDTGAPTPKRLKEIRELSEERRREAERRSALEAERQRLAEERLGWWEIRKRFAPEGEEELRPIFCEALRRLPELDWRLDALENEMGR